MQLKKSKGLTLWIVVGTLLFLGAVGGLIYISNLKNEAAALRQQKQTELNTAIAKIRNLPKLKDEVATLEAEEIRLAQFIPSKEGQAEFVWELQELAEQSNITITSCKIEKESKEYQDTKDYKVYQWQVTISGKYQGLIHFLEILPQAKRSVMVSNLKVTSVTSGDAVQDGYVLNVDMMLDLITSSGEKVKHP